MVGMEVVVFLDLILPPVACVAILIRGDVSPVYTPVVDTPVNEHPSLTQSTNQ